MLNKHRYDIRILPMLLLTVSLLATGWAQNKRNNFTAQDGSFRVAVDTKFSEVAEKSFVMKLVSSDDQLRVQKRRIPNGRKVNNPKAFLDAPPTWKVDKKYMGTIGGHPVAIIVCTPDMYKKAGLKAIIASFEKGNDFWQFHYAFPAQQVQRAEADFKKLAASVKWL